MVPNNTKPFVCSCFNSFTIIGQHDTSLIGDFRSIIIINFIVDSDDEEDSDSEEDFDYEEDSDSYEEEITKETYNGEPLDKDIDVEGRMFIDEEGRKTIRDKGRNIIVDEDY